MNVTLVNGREVSSHSSEWKVECLARHALSLPSLERRRAWLQDFEMRCGVRAAADLMESMQQVHAARKVAA
jgi:hypothetical protein